jgi:uncharacterized glyoxalase superfamily protein PhnB
MVGSAHIGKRTMEGEKRCPKTNKQVWPDIYPVLRYKNGTKAMEWLTEVFGFSKHMEVPGPDGEIGHAELTLGNGMIMFASGGKPGDDNPWTTERGGVYAVIDDIEAHYQRAKAAGAEIVRPLADTSYGAREYSVRDPEWHLWSFGTYRP